MTSPQKNPNRIGYYPGAHPRNNVTAFLEDHVANNPHFVALKWVNPIKLTEWKSKPRIAGTFAPLEHDSITSSQLLESIERVGAGFAEMGIRTGDRVVLFVPMSLPLYVAMFALQRVGAIPVFLDSWARRNHLGASAKIVAPKAMISFEKAFQLCDEVPELSNVGIKICVGPATRKYTATLEELTQFPQRAPAIAVEQEQTALITFTTGSSGVPKGANRTHRFLAAQHYALNECIPYTNADADLPVFPIFSLNNLAAGVTTVIPAFDIGVPGELDAEILLAQINTCNVTCTTLSPSLFNRFSAYCVAHSLTLPKVRRVVTGGAPVSRDNVIEVQKATPAAEVWVLFGSTEAEPMAHIEGKEMVQQKTRASVDPDWVDDGVNVGKMAHGLEYRFLKIDKNPIEIQSASDWTPRVVPEGSVGELIVAGEHVCRDYFNDTEAFLRAKIRDENGTIWHRTGDLGRLDSEGNLWIVGRVHNAIQRGGEYVFPVRAEMILKKIPAIRLCAYLGVADATLGERTVCVVTSDQSPETVTPEINRLMTHNGMPVDQIIFRSSIPMDPRHHSKVEYETLRKELIAAGELK